MRTSKNFLSATKFWLRALQDTLAVFPWRTTVLTLRERFRADHLGLTASSLTFTTTIALVPMMTVLLAVFTAFPMFAKFQAQLQQWLIASLIPDSIARQVLGYLTQFAGKASKLGGVGLAVLFVTSLALILTIDRTLNSIWRVRKSRPLSQRVLVYWALMTLGPLLMASSLSLTSYAVSASTGLVGRMPGGVEFLLGLLQFGLFSSAMAALYYYVPNTEVRWRHALTGGVFVAFSLEIAKRLLVAYLDAVPTYSVLYGAFATLPILLIWIYTAWVIVLLGAVIVAYLPSLLMGIARHASSAPGWSFLLALELLQHLSAARATPVKGLTMQELSRRMHVDVLQCEPVVQALLGLDWLGSLQVSHDQHAVARLVLLADPSTTPLEPLLEVLLLKNTASTQRFRQASRWQTLTLKDVL